MDTIRTDVRKIQERLFEADLKIPGAVGQNTFGDHSALGPTEFRAITNFDIVRGTARDQLKSRRGSQWLRPAESPTRYKSTVIDGIVWDTGISEYLITQQGTKLYSQNLTTIGNPTKITDLLTGGAFALGSTDSAEFVLDNDRLLVFHPAGNKVIQWDATGSTFGGRVMGMAYPTISSLATSEDGTMSGKYTYGIEKCYFDSTGRELLASTPNRQMSSGAMATTQLMGLNRARLIIVNADLDNDTLWTHLRLWRSKRQTPDLSDPANPIDAVGLQNELYEVALITKEEISTTTYDTELLAISTAAGMPPGNAGVRAGKYGGGYYEIIDDNDDDVLFDMVDDDRIELVPLPAAGSGCFCAGKLWVTGVTDSTAWNDTSGSKLFYSLWAGTKYSEQINPLQFVETGRDGKKCLKVLAMEKDLIACKETKIGRVPDGNPDLGFDVLDHNVGVAHRRAAEWITGIGLCAITSQNNDFMVFTRDLMWRSDFFGQNISQALREQSKAWAAANIRMAYINQKLLIFHGTGNAFVLHVGEGRGWTKYDYALSTSNAVVVFANGSRAAVVSAGEYLVEIEVQGLDTDIDTDTEIATAIATSVTTPRLSSGDGANILEMERLSLMATLSQPASCEVFVNDEDWPGRTVATIGQFMPTPAAAGTGDAMKEREYRYYPQPATIGIFSWCPPTANYLHFKIDSAAPCSFREIVLRAIVDEDTAWGSFDPFQLDASEDSRNPLWLDDVIQETGAATTVYQETGTATTTIQER